MEDKNIRELSMDEMDRVSGGSSMDIKALLKGRACMNCGASDPSDFSLIDIIPGFAQIKCNICGLTIEI